MAKRHRSLKKSNKEFEASEQIDDHLLPTPEELAAYKAVDTKLPDFLKNAGEKEQNFRHTMNKKAMKLSFREQYLQYGLNYLGLLFAFLIGIAGMVISYLLLEMGKDIHGSIFGGATILYLAYLFTRSRYRSERDN